MQVYSIVNRGFLPIIVQLTLSYYHRETPSNAIKSFCLCNLCFHLINVLTIFPFIEWIIRRLRCIQFFVVFYNYSALINSRFWSLENKSTVVRVNIQRWLADSLTTSLSNS